MSGTLRILQNAFRTLKLTVLVLIGAVLHVSFIATTIWYWTQTGILTKVPEFQAQFASVAIGYFVLTIVYCTFISATTRPKIVVSALHIQIVTTAFVIFIISATFVIYNPTFATEQARSNTISNIMLISMVLVVTGLLQQLLVRELLGLTGSKEDMDKQTYVINTSFERVSRQMTNNAFLKRFLLSKKVEEKEFLVILTKRQAITDQILILMPEDNDGTRCVLTIISYQILFDTFFKTEAARNEREAILGTLERALRIEKPTNTIENRALDYEESLKQAYYYALKPTEAKLASLRDIPARFAYSIIALIVIGIGFSIAYFVTSTQAPPLVGREALIGAWIAIAVGIITQLLPSLRDKVSKLESRQSL